MTPYYRGLTWDHPRGVTALRAAACKVAPEQGLTLNWDTQPLEGFESHPIADLCARYDLVVLDHPHVGEAVEAGCLVPLEELFEPNDLAMFSANSMGPSFSSYRYQDQHWALPLDAATQVMAYRPDLVRPVSSWGEIEILAEQGRVALSLAGPHAALSLLSIATALGEPPAERDPAILLSSTIAERSFSLLAEIYAKVNVRVLALNPIGLLDHMTRYDDVRLCPLVYGYVNYTRPDLPGKALRFANTPVQQTGNRPGSTLGGTGIGISRHCAVTPQLLRHLHWLMQADTQCNFIAAHEGQPSHGAAWRDAGVNAQWGNFYRDTAATLEAAYVRPRYTGYIAWQTAISHYLREALAQGVSGACVAEHLNISHRQAIGERAR